MAITSTGSVLIQKPDDVSTSLMMGKFRDWLNANRVEPTLFKSSELSDGTTVFEVAFRNADEAALFNVQFG